MLPFTNVPVATTFPFTIYSYTNLPAPALIFSEFKTYSRNNFFKYKEEKLKDGWSVLNDFLKSWTVLCKVPVIKDKNCFTRQT